MPTWLIWTLGLGVPLAAASVPIVIHLINLTRYRKVDWAAMEFLLNAYQKTRRRMQMESLIMLLLRVMAIILIAMALFPMGCERITDWTEEQLGIAGGSLDTDAPLHLIVILDNSASMDYEQEGQSAFERARQYAQTLVDGLEQNRDRVSLIRVSDVYVPPGLGGAVLTDEEADESRQRRIKQVTSLNLDAARREINATQVAAVDTNMLAAFREASRLTERTPESDAVGLVVVSDFYHEGWKELGVKGAAHDDFVEVVSKINERLKTSGTSPIFYDAGFLNTQNVTITNVDVAERVVGEGMTAKVSVDVAYYSSNPKAERKTVRLKYRVDGGSEKMVDQTVELQPNETRRSIGLTLTPDELKLETHEKKSGASRNIEIFTQDADSLKNDNSRNVVIHVVPNIPILVVNGSPHPDESKDETFYLNTALGISSSRADGTAGPTDVNITPNKVVTMRADELAAVDGFLDYRLVILANVRDIPENVVSKLTEFVEAGFGLIIFDGDNVDYQKYNSMLYKDGEGILPARLSGTGGSDDATTAPHYGLGFGDKNHPVLALFTENDETRTIVTDSEAVHNWRTLKLPEAEEVDPLRPTRVLLTLNTKPDPQPLLVERSYGRGKVMYMATSVSEKWNSLWRSANGLPLFLYLEMASYLTSNEARYSNLAVGEPYRRVLRVTDIAPRYQVRDPEGTESELVSTAEDGLKLLEYAGTAQPGVYTVQAQDRAEGDKYIRKWEERFAVNLEPAESDVRRFSPTEENTDAKKELETNPSKDAELALEEALGDVAFAFQRAGEELDGDGVIGDEGDREWLWLAVVGALFLMFETLWSGVISKPED